MEEIIVDNLRKLEAEFPAYAAEVIAWHIYQSLVALIIGLIMIICSSACIRWVWNRRVSDDVFHPVTTIPLLLASFVLMIGFIICLISSEGLAKAHLAPRLVVIESLKQKVSN